MAFDGDFLQLNSSLSSPLVADSLKLPRVHVPHYRFEKEEALLECDYELGSARLYAVKWYKDNEEFFRYVPRFKPPIKTHRVEGVTVDVSRFSKE